MIDLIDTRLLTFLTLLEEKNYTKTANRLYITQPAVTHHIKSLEKDLNITLFKDNKSFDLTNSGILLKEYALVAKSQYSQFQNAISKQDTHTKINLAFTPFSIKCMINQHIKDVLYSNRIKINTYVKDYKDIIEMLTMGSLDFAIIDEPFDSSIFESFALSTTDIILVCNPNGQYSKKNRVTREEFSKSVLVLGDENSGLYKDSIQAFSNKNIKINNNSIIYSNDIDCMKEIILSFDGIGIVYHDAFLKELEAGSLKKIEMLNFKATQNIYIIYNRNAFLDDDVRKLIDLIYRKYSVIQND